MNLFEVAEEITRRLKKIFLRNGNGDRPVYGGMRKLQDDPYWRDYILYFHGDDGADICENSSKGMVATN